MAHYRNSTEIPLILVGTQGKKIFLYSEIVRFSCNNTKNEMRNLGTVL